MIVVMKIVAKNEKPTLHKFDRLKKSNFFQMSHFFYKTKPRHINFLKLSNYRKIKRAFYKMGRFIKWRVL